MNLLNLEYEKYKLDNGLEVILHPDNSVPLVAVNLWYRVGSANEVKGKTGIAHLFEHMMFQGSQNVPKEMHFRFVQEAGGSLNGSTSFDRTNYYEKVPSNFLELILWLESDRMGFLLPALDQEKLQNQIDVVRNERLERYDNQPYGLAWETIITTLYPEGHPYSWPTIGFLGDISNYTLDDVSGFFKKYYAPNNASLVIAGSYDKNQVKDLVGKYFSPIPYHNGLQPLSPPHPVLKENVFIARTENVQLSRIYMVWPTVKAYDPEDGAIDILSDVLSGSKSSRLYKALVFDNEAAQDITAYQFSGKYAGHFMIIATAKPGISLEFLRSQILRIIHEVAEKGISEKELLRAKNGIRSSFIYSMQNIESLADHLNFYNYYFNEPNSFNHDLHRYTVISSDMVKDACTNFLTKHFVELHITPDKDKK